MSLRLTLAAGVAAAALAPTALDGALGPRYGGQTTLRVSSLPQQLQPAVGGSPVTAALLHETLVDYDPEHGLLPGVAASWTSAAGGREWQLRLSPWARFHDDTPVDAQDAARSVRRFLRSPSPAAALLAERLEGGAAFRAGRAEQLPGVTAPAPDRLALRLLRPAPLVLASLAAPAAAVTSSAGRGCGPFAATSFEPGRRLVAKAAATHPRGRPFLDRVELVVRQGGDAGTREAHVARLASLLILQLAPTAAPFDRIEARRLVDASIDRSLLAARFLRGAQATAALLPATLTPPRPSPPPVSGRLAGRISLAVAGDVAPSASQRVVAHLDALGLEVEVRVVPSEALATARDAARLRVWTPEVAERGLALRELSGLLPAPASAGRALRRAEAELDASLRDEALDEVEAALRQEAALLPLAALPVGYVSGPDLRDAGVDAAGRLRLEDAWVPP